MNHSLNLLYWLSAVLSDIWLGNTSSLSHNGYSASRGLRYNVQQADTRLNNSSAIESGSLHKLSKDLLSQQYNALP